MTPETVTPDATKVETPVVQTPEQLMALIAAAGAGGDLAEVIRLGNQLKKHQGDILKAEAEKLKAEAEAMAGGRAKLAAEILKGVKATDVKNQLTAVKATGYTFKLPSVDATGTEVSASVALTVPTVKTAKTGGGGGGSTGALKTQTGLSRHELVEQYATEEEKAGIAKAESEATSRPDSARYTAEKPVIKRILGDNPSLIKH